MMLTDLADACRRSGLNVVEVAGWRTRGHGQIQAVRTIVPHHTATSGAVPGNYPSMRIVRDGRAGLAGPLANLGLGRDGTVYVIAAGLAYHAGVVRNPAYGNAYSIGIEAEHPGVGPWPAQQYDAYVRLCAALAKHYDLSVGHVLGHKEVCSPIGRKVDPSFDMAPFRAEIARVLAPKPPKRIRRTLDELRTEISRTRKARAVARERGERPEPYTAVIKKMRAARRRAKEIR